MKGFKFLDTNVECYFWEKSCLVYQISRNNFRNSMKSGWSKRSISEVFEDFNGLVVKGLIDRCFFHVRWDHPRAVLRGGGHQLPHLHGDHVQRRDRPGILRGMAQRV